MVLANNDRLKLMKRMKKTLLLYILKKMHNFAFKNGGLNVRQCFFLIKTMYLMHNC